MSFEPRDYLLHILGEAEYLRRASASTTAEAFLEDETLKRAFVRSVEIIGEAVKKLPEEMRSAHPQIPWSAIARMRDRVIHGYFGVDYQLVWDVVTTKVPELKDAVETILRDG